MQAEKQGQKYAQYRALSQTEKKRRIDQAKQDPNNRRPNPAGDHVFNDENFVEFKVQQDGHELKLYTYRYKTSHKDTKGVVFLHHGLNSHLGRAAHIGWFLAERGYDTVGFDHRGFGRSEGRKGFMIDLEHHLEDCRQFIDTVAPMYANLPKFVMGESMGGMTSYYLTLKAEHIFDGAILVAPALMNQIGGFLVGISKVMATIMPKMFSYPRPSITGRSESNPQISDANLKDPYYLKDKFCFTTLQTLASTLQKTPATFKDYKCPFIVIQGGLDKIINPQGAFELFDNCQTPANLKQLLFYENVWHDVLHQDEIFEIMENVYEWIQKIAKAKTQKMDE